MKTNTRKERIVARITAGIFVVVVVANVYLMGTNATLKSRLNEEKLKNELLLSENLTLAKEMMKGVFESENKVLQESTVTLQLERDVLIKPSD